jgi:hypothetical protein
MRFASGAAPGPRGSTSAQQEASIDLLRDELREHVAVAGQR